MRLSNDKGNQTLFEAKDVTIIEADYGLIDRVFPSHASKLSFRY